MTVTHPHPHSAPDAFKSRRDAARSYYGNQFDLQLHSNAQGIGWALRYTSLAGIKGQKGEPGLSCAGFVLPGSCSEHRGQRGQKGETGDVGVATGQPIHWGRGTPTPKGSKGEKGERGLPGFKGEQGKEGTPGSICVAGPKGLKGASGAVGQEGKPGLPGPPGQPGTAIPGPPVSTILTRKMQHSQH
ncbi:hypothetical protein AGOR_G00101410 [Albula goreensis]|uniref:Uncharacterized protein n=1 Tax=Albula goreensis TaxID=1534307 RepID=A0A8T3DGM5_9TELE|nr:hypothetical protein AGOR_G00101410 [Albula goreensis]